MGRDREGESCLAVSSDGLSNLALARSWPSRAVETLALLCLLAQQKQQIENDESICAVSLFPFHSSFGVTPFA
eukprot:1077128-Pleurochrysis_carterae.AAC.1